MPKFEMFPSSFEDVGPPVEDEKTDSLEKEPRKVDVYAHRCGWTQLRDDIGLTPEEQEENSMTRALESFKHVDGMEIDVILTKDGVSAWYSRYI